MVDLNLQKGFNLPRKLKLLKSIPFRVIQDQIYTRQLLTITYCQQTSFAIYFVKVFREIYCMALPFIKTLPFIFYSFCKYGKIDSNENVVEILIMIVTTSSPFQEFGTNWEKQTFFFKENWKIWSRIYNWHLKHVFIIPHCPPKQ